MLVNRILISLLANIGGQIQKNPAFYLRLAFYDNTSNYKCPWLKINFGLKRFPAQ